MNVQWQLFWTLYNMSSTATILSSSWTLDFSPIYALSSLWSTKPWVTNLLSYWFWSIGHFVTSDIGALDFYFVMFLAVLEIYSMCLVSWPEWRGWISLYSRIQIPLLRPSVSWLCWPLLSIRGQTLLSIPQDPNFCSQVLSEKSSILCQLTHFFWSTCAVFPDLELDFLNGFVQSSCPCSFCP